MNYILLLWWEPDLGLIVLRGLSSRVRTKLV